MLMLNGMMHTLGVSFNKAIKLSRLKLAHFYFSSKLVEIGVGLVSCKILPPAMQAIDKV